MGTASGASPSLLGFLAVGPLQPAGPYRAP